MTRKPLEGHATRDDPRSPCRLGEHQAEAQKWDSRFYWMLATLFLWRLIYIAIAPLDLVPDEAYYWDWSRELAWGYYSKPPLVAWVNALSSALLGASPFAVRLPAVVLGSLSLLALHRFAAHLFNHRVAFWSAAALAASPMSAGFAFLMTIDTLLLCFWTLALYSLWRALEDNAANGRWWLLSALAIGLGLLSKQMMLVFLVLTALHLALTRKHRLWLSRPWPYLMTLLALLALAPPLWWNMNHGWITFQHTAHHFELPSEPRAAYAHLWTFLGFVGTQLFLISPLTWLLLAALALPLLLGIRRQAHTTRFLLLFSAVPLLFFVLASVSKPINANWPAAFYPAGMVLLAGWAQGALSTETRLDRWRTLFVSGVLVGVCFAVLTYGLTFLLQGASLGGSKLDPTARLKGWQALAQALDRTRQRLPRPHQTFMLASGRQYVSEMAFYLPQQPKVYRWNDHKDRVQTQYDLWPGPIDKLGWDALIILEPHQPVHSDLASAFRSLTPLGELSVPIGPAGKRSLSLYLGHSLRYWPR